MREIEIKFKLKNYESSILEFSKKSIPIVSKVTQIDNIYLEEKVNFQNLKNKNVLRIRQEKDLKTNENISTFTLKKYKKIKLDRIEYETEIFDADSLGKIIIELNYKLKMTITKQRVKYKIGDYNISIDRVENLGDFIEIEQLSYSMEEDYNSIKDKMIAFLNDCQINLGEEIKIPYDTLIEQQELKN